MKVRKCYIYMFNEARILFSTSDCFHFQSVDVGVFWSPGPNNILKWLVWNNTTPLKETIVLILYLIICSHFLVRWRNKGWYHTLICKNTQNIKSTTSLTHEAIYRLLYLHLWLSPHYKTYHKINHDTALTLNYSLGLEATKPVMSECWRDLYSSLFAS